MPSHRADTATPPLQRPRTNRGSRSAGSQRRSATGVQRPNAARRPLRKPGSSLSAPQVGIAGALGIATIAAPISGAMADQMPKAQVNQISSTVSMVSAVAIPNAANAAGAGVASLAVVPADVGTTADTPSMLAAPKTIIVSRASRAGERSVLPGCSGVPVTGASNGQLPSTSLCTLWDPDHRLRADAAVALAKLNIAYKQEFGNDICLTDSYRTLSEQYSVRASKPTLSAVPGTSNHGWGMAVDLCDGVNTGGGSRFQWLVDNAASYGWENPDWAQSGGGGPYEPWHWEYAAGQ